MDSKYEDDEPISVSSNALRDWVYNFLKLWNSGNEGHRSLVVIEKKTEKRKKIEKQSTKRLQSQVQDVIGILFLSANRQEIGAHKTMFYKTIVNNLSMYRHCTKSNWKTFA